MHMHMHDEPCAAPRRATPRWSDGSISTLPFFLISLASTSARNAVSPRADRTVTSQAPAAPTPLPGKLSASLTPHGLSRCATALTRSEASLILPCACVAARPKPPCMSVRVTVARQRRAASLRSCAIQRRRLPSRALVLSSNERHFHPSHMPATSESHIQNHPATNTRLTLPIHPRLANHPTTFGVHATVRPALKGSNAVL